VKIEVRGKDMLAKLEQSNIASRIAVLNNGIFIELLGEIPAGDCYAIDVELSLYPPEVSQVFRL
jgi:hypothetical protein